MFLLGLLFLWHRSSVRASQIHRRGGTLGSSFLSHFDRVMRKPMIGFTRPFVLPTGDTGIERTKIRSPHVKYVRQMPLHAGLCLTFCVFEMCRAFMSQPLDRKDRSICELCLPNHGQTRQVEITRLYTLSAQTFPQGLECQPLAAITEP